MHQHSLRFLISFHFIAFERNSIERFPTHRRNTISIVSGKEWNKEFPNKCTQWCTKDTARQRKLTLSLTHSFACSRTSFHFLYLRLMKKYYLSTASAATSAVLLTVSYSFHSFLHLSLDNSIVHFLLCFVTKAFSFAILSLDNLQQSLFFQQE